MTTASNSVGANPQQAAAARHKVEQAVADLERALKGASANKNKPAPGKPASTGSGSSQSAQDAETARETRRAAPDPKVAAQQVLDAGKRPFIKDNYEERMKALSSALQNGDDAYRHQLMQEILKRDPGAANSWLTSERADTLLKQGEISQQDRDHISTVMADVDVKHIKELLSDQGLGGFDRNDHMKEAVSLITKGGSDRVNYVMSQLSDAELQQLAGNIEHGGTHGAQGLTADQRKAFYSQLAYKANPDQLVRYMDTTSNEQRAIILDVAARQGTSGQLISLMQALNNKVKADPNPKHAPMLNATMLMAAVGNASSPDVREKFLAAVGQMGQFKGVAKLDQFKAAWGQNQDKRFAIASMLMQDPTLTPQRLTHDQDMAKLSDAAYGRPSAPSYYKAVNLSDPNLDPRLKGLTKADFEDTKTGFSSQLFLDTRTNTYVLAFRGSNEWTKDYGQANIPQALGKGSPQYTEAMNLALTVQKRLGPDLTDITGHSLGGGLAAAASIVTGIRTTTFDAAGVHPNTIAPYGKTLTNGNNVTNYRVRDEVLTWVQEEGPTAGPAYDAVGKQITVEVFDRGNNMLTGADTLGVGRGNLHSTDYAMRGLLIG